MFYFTSNVALGLWKKFGFLKIQTCKEPYKTKYSFRNSFQICDFYLSSIEFKSKFEAGLFETWSLCTTAGQIWPSLLHLQRGLCIALCGHQMTCDGFWLEFTCNWDERHMTWLSLPKWLAIIPYLQLLPFDKV